MSGRVHEVSNLHKTHPDHLHVKAFHTTFLYHLLSLSSKILHAAPRDVRCLQMRSCWIFEQCQVRSPQNQLIHNKTPSIQTQFTELSLGGCTCAVIQRNLTARAIV